MEGTQISEIKNLYGRVIAIIERGAKKIKNKLTVKMRMLEDILPCCKQIQLSEKKIEILQ